MRRPRNPARQHELRNLEFQTMNHVPDGFLRFSEAVNRFGRRHVGVGLQRPVPVATTKHIAQNLSVGFGLWREQAGQRPTGCEA